MDRERLIAGPGLRFAGWLVDSLLIGAIGLALRLLGVTGWPRLTAVEVLVLLDAVAVVARFGGNVGNLAVGTRVVVADDGRGVGPGRAAIRWAVIRLPMYAAALAGALWLIVVWAIVVYGPILFTRLRQGLHDRAAGVVVVASRRAAERWTLANVAGRLRPRPVT